MMPKSSWWWITAQHRETKQEKKYICKFTGPMPLADEMDFYCPPDVCVITEMKFAHNDGHWVDDSLESQQSLYNKMKEELKQRRKEIYG